jgi:CRP/FNR family transcriptional regulator
MISSSEFSELILLYPILAKLSPALRSGFEQEAWELEFPAGRALFDVGSYCRSFLFLTSGSLNVISYQDSRQILLFTIRPGEWCWLTATCLLAGRPHMACGIVSERITAIAISGELFLQLVSESKEFRRLVLRFFGEGLSQLMTLIQEVTFQRVDQRLAAILAGKGERITITHQELADELGSVREVVSRILRDFERQGYLQRGRGQIRILNRAALEEIARHEGD